MSNAERRGREGAIDRVRYQRITRFFAGVILHLIFWDIILRRLLPSRVIESRPERWRGLSRGFRQLAVEMGGVLIKLGQFLSARVDVLPPEITEELKGLQDEVPAVATGAILAVMEEELGDLSAHFALVEDKPLAAASLGQVHRARLKSLTGSEEGAPVVVKVQRPGIVQVVRTDLAALRVVARWIMRYPPIRRRADMPALLEEFAQTLWEELDYEMEADNAERFADMFAGDEGVYIPYVYRRHSTRRVLVLENVEAIKIIDLASMEAAGIDRKKVAQRLLDTYFYQIFKEGFFHADPHPGNLFVQPRAGAVGAGGATSTPFSLVFVDFGMVGSIRELTGDRLRSVLVAVTQRDARALTLAFRDLGFFLPGADVERITEAVAFLLDEMWGRDLLELAQPDPREVQAISQQFKDILFDFPFQVPQDFVYLGRAIGILSGIASMLDPQINPWYHVERYGRDIIQGEALRQIGWQALLESLRPFVEVPAQLQRVLSAAEQGRLHIEATPDRATARRLQRIDRKLTQLQFSLLAAAGLVSGTLLFISRRGEREKKE